MSTETKMNPMIILPYGQMLESQIKLLRDNGICVVTAKDPSKIRFVDPIPAASSRTQMENAAIKLSRLLLNGTWNPPDRSLDRSDFCRFFVEFLVEGTPLDKSGTVADREKIEYNYAHLDEVRKMAREDARAERESKKAKQAATAPPKNT